MVTLLKANKFCSCTPTKLIIDGNIRVLKLEFTLILPLKLFDLNSLPTPLYSENPLVKQGYF
jgi:hypothetical protein